MIYLDNAATSWPKPPCVKEAIAHFLDKCGANPGRAGHRKANESARIVYKTREAVAELFYPHDLQKGVTAALEGLRIDPLNLPLRANLGSLRLLEAQKAEEQNSYEERDRLLKDAETIFLRLKETGWDPGFVAYRLGRINRGQGKFEEAIKYQEAAKDKDVARTRIQAEIERALAEDNRLSR